VLPSAWLPLESILRQQRIDTVFVDVSCLLHLALNKNPRLKARLFLAPTDAAVVDDLLAVLRARVLELRAAAAAAGAAIRVFFILDNRRAAFNPPTKTPEPAETAALDALHYWASITDAPPSLPALANLTAQQVGKFAQLLGTCASPRLVLCEQLKEAIIVFAGDCAKVIIATSDADAAAAAELAELGPSGCRALCLTGDNDWMLFPHLGCVWFSSAQAKRGLTRFRSQAEVNIPFFFFHFV